MCVWYVMWLVCIYKLYDHCSGVILSVFFVVQSCPVTKGILYTLSKFIPANIYFPAGLWLFFLFHSSCRDKSLLEHTTGKHDHNTGGNEVWGK